MNEVAQQIAQELQVSEKAVMATIELLDQGDTVPFIARYRKEQTGGLDDTQLRELESRLGYLRELSKRKDDIVALLEEAGKLTAELKAQILSAETKARVEDLYLPYKTARRTKATIAREAGLEALLEELLDPAAVQTPDELAQEFIQEGFSTPKEAIAGARAIMVEDISHDADLVGTLRQEFFDNGRISSTVVPGKESEGEKFKDYFDFAEDFARIPSHRLLALYRGEAEGILKLVFDVDNPEHFTDMIAGTFNLVPQGLPTDSFRAEVLRFAWKTKLFLSSAVESRMKLKESADDDAVRIFGRNLQDLLLASPAGPKATMGLDPGYRNGVKIAVVDSTGKVVDTTIIYPHQPQNQWDRAVAELTELSIKHGVELLAIGNGTASRETVRLAQEISARVKEAGYTPPVQVTVSEAGASVYSASELAAKEFPNMDVSLRGAVSIARRLQDPLAELVKIDPKSIGVGQYQHDVNQAKLVHSLEAVVEDAVNSVGVDVNTASVALLERVSGINSTIAHNIVQWRDQNGRFEKRSQLKKVPRLGDKAFEQSAGFLRIHGGSDVLDTSAVHPESYAVVKKISVKTGMDIKDLVGNSVVLSGIRPEEYVSDEYGVPTITDILSELEKPGRDPRPEFMTATFKEGVEKVSDLKPGMILEGTVSNVAAFGAFVDVGVHQDGLVHISAMSDTYVSDPRTIVKSGDIVKVKVIEVDESRKRIALSLRLNDEPGQPHPADKSRTGGNKISHQKNVERRGTQRIFQRDSQQKRRNGSPADYSSGEGSLAAALRKAGFQGK